MARTQTTQTNDAQPRAILERARTGYEDVLTDETTRISVDSDGNATSRTPGDLQGASAAPVEPGARGVRIVIDEVL